MTLLEKYKIRPFFSSYLNIDIYPHRLTPSFKSNCHINSSEYFKGFIVNDNYIYYYNKTLFI